MLPSELCSRVYSGRERVRCTGDVARILSQMGERHARPASPGNPRSRTRFRKFVPPASRDRPHGIFCLRRRRLLDFLSEHQVNTLIVSGGETDVCVLSTVLSAIDLGYRIILVEDALCSSSDDSHDAIISLYRQRFNIQSASQMFEQIVGSVGAGIIQ